MRLENKIYKAILLTLLFVFLPVLACVMLLGNNMNYNSVCKLETLCPNYVLVFIGGLMVFFYGIMYKRLKRTKITPKNEWLVNILLLVGYIIIFFFNLEIAKCIYLEQGWDVSCVRYKAIELTQGFPIGEFDSYFSVYSNNVPITYVLFKLYEIAKSIDGFSYTYDFFWIIINCVMISVSGFLVCQTVKKISSNVFATFLAFGMFSLCVCATPWKTTAYTDMYAIMFPVFCIYFYTHYYFAKNRIIKCLFWFAIYLFGFLGALIKPPVLIICIAIFIIEMINSVLHIKTSLPDVLIRIFMIGIVVFLYLEAKEFIYKETEFIYNENASVTYHHYLLMGISENSTGSYDSNVLWYHGQFLTPEERIPAQWERYKMELANHGLAGYPFFLLKKMVMTFNDGTFGWGREGSYTYYSFPTFSNAPYAPFLRDIFWPNFKYSGRFNTYSQLIWLFIIYAIPGICLGKKDNIKLSATIALSMLGIMGYLMLFETRARYLICFLPLIIINATLGMQQYARIISFSILKIQRKMHKKKK